MILPGSHRTWMNCAGNSVWTEALPGSTGDFHRCYGSQAQMGFHAKPVDNEPDSTIAESDSRLLPGVPNPNRCEPGRLHRNEEHRS